MKKEMNPAWLFKSNEGKKSFSFTLWAKCKNCRKWNRIERADIKDLSPLPKKPIEEPCQKCGNEKGIFIERVFFARKGMKEPKWP
jgi:hypothetical protein